jgi:hypothetical protein
VVDRKVSNTGMISYAGARYSVARALAGQRVQVTRTDSVVQIFKGEQLLRTWSRDRHSPANQAPISVVVDRKVWGTGRISYAGALYGVARALAGQLVQVTVDDGMVRISQDGQLLRTWPRRHPPAKELLIRPDRSHQSGEVTRDQAHRLAPLDDLDTDPRVVHRLVDRRGLLSFAGRYYGAGRALAGQVVQVRCAGGIVQVTHGGELVHAWQQRHTPEQEQRMLQRPNLQQRIANAGY